MSESYLLVGVGEERYGLAVDEVLEVGAISDPAPVPGAPPGVIGLQNLRGEVVPLLDLASLVGAGPREPGEAMVVVEHDGRRAALAVDSLFDVAPLEGAAARRDEAPPLHSSVLVGGSLVGLLDVKTLLDSVSSGGAR